MKREDVRRENARKLAEKAGGKTEFGRMLDMEGSQVSQIIGPNPTKNIGNSIAKRIEIAFDMPEGWLDIESLALEPAQMDKPETETVIDRTRLERLDENEAALVAIYRECGERERDALLSHAARLLPVSNVVHTLFRRNKT